MSRREDVKDILIGLVFYIVSCSFFIWLFEYILMLLFGEANG